ncbi:MAG: DUF167 domain-containing protein [Deltaproteobacteria bacterium]|nr:DUF167 domain-containing protein [Deltaproteobacteria bacterium]
MAKEKRPKEATVASARIAVHAKPRAKASRIVAVGDVVEVALAAPPVDGAANDELIRFLSEVLEVPKSSITLVRGQSSRHKQLSVAGLGQDEAVRRLSARL